jgi:hypothetical protein
MPLKMGVYRSFKHHPQVRGRPPMIIGPIALFVIIISIFVF